MDSRLTAMLMVFFLGASAGGHSVVVPHTLGCHLPTKDRAIGRNGWENKPTFPPVFEPEAAS